MILSDSILNLHLDYEFILYWLFAICCSVLFFNSVLQGLLIYLMFNQTFLSKHRKGLDQSKSCFFLKTYSTKALVPVINLII